MIRLQATHPRSTQLEQHLQRWLDAAPEHREAWAQLQQLQQRFEQARDVASRHPGQSDQARRLLERPTRRVALRSLAVMAVGGAFAAGWADRQFPLRQIGADLRTATAQRRRIVLDDGSTLVLDARSAVDVRLSDELRGLTLRAGRLMLQAAADPRPLLLASQHARVTLLRGELMLERDETGSTVAVLADHALVEAADGSRLQLLAGQVARLHSHGIALLHQSPRQLSAWTNGRLVLDDVPLSTLIDRLRPYRRDYLRVSSAAARLRVQGVFSLDDSDSSLTSIAETLPVAITRHGPLTLIDRR